MLLYMRNKLATFKKFKHQECTVSALMTLFLPPLLCIHHDTITKRQTQQGKTPTAEFRQGSGNETDMAVMFTSNTEPFLFTSSTCSSELLAKFVFFFVSITSC